VHVVDALDGPVDTRLLAEFGPGRDQWFPLTAPIAPTAVPVAPSGALAVGRVTGDVAGDAAPQSRRRPDGVAPTQEASLTVGAGDTGDDRPFVHTGGTVAQPINTLGRQPKRSTL